MDNQMLFTAITGIVFLTLLLTIGLLIMLRKSSEPIPREATFIFRVILSIAAAALGTALTGFIEVTGEIPGWTIRSAGAFALFVMVFFLNPPELAQKRAPKSIAGHDSKNQPTNSNDKSKIISYKIDRKVARFGITLGWQLARLELIEGSTLPEAQAVSTSIKQDINQLLEQDNYQCSMKKLDARQLIHSLISYYSTINLDKHTLILIGIAAMRTSLIGASNNEDHNIEMKSLAFSAVQEVDSSVIPDKKAFFDSLIRKKPKNITEVLEILDDIDNDYESSKRIV